ncbi:MAG: hypothetical protein ACT4PU_05880 [Planctomycetota bacterium]
MTSRVATQEAGWLRSGSLAASVLVVLAAMTAPLRADVIVVAVAGSGDFTTVQAAIDAAADGDTILVRIDTLTEVLELSGKALAIVGDIPVGSTTRRDVGCIAVRNLAAGQQVVLRNLRFEGDFQFPTYDNLSGIFLIDNEGSVWIEDCVSTGRAGVGSAICGCNQWGEVPSGFGISMKNCLAVTIVGGTLQGGHGGNAFSACTGGFGVAGIAVDGGAGISAEASLLALYSTTVTGGKGGAGHYCAEIAHGGHGINAKTSQVFLSGCTVTGGVQGAGPPAGQPGDGVRGDASTSFELLDTNVAAAPGGTNYATAPGAVTTFPGVARSFRLTSPLREQQAGTLSMQGEQGDFVGFFWSFTNGMLPMPARNGWFLLNSPFLAGPFLVGAISDPSGSWDFPMTGPDLPAALEAQSFLLQAYFVHGGGVTLSSGTSFTLVDQSF